ncbi:MAG: DEAD/DEAH box helicase, partial [Actinobacteria bacterium]|nr:DEAD/DEAH box helicase [Actinomycetota bacterium]
MSPLTAVQETTFKDLGLHSDLIRTLNNQGITVPFPIQAATIPDAIAGCDILGRGQTGSGKTLAFGLALLHNIYGKRAKPHQPLALVLAPTRELAQQIDEVLHPLAHSIGHDSVVIAGGMPYGKQVNALKKATSILVATPGRLIDLLEKDEVSFEALQITVLDEADQMADMGFLPAVKQILNQTRKGSQRMLFSATLDRGVDGLVRQYLNDPKSHSIKEIEGSKEKSDFKDQDSAVLVATDVAARGIHVDDIDLVVHFDAPADHKDYLHRSGRTARAGKTGRVVTLATH